MALLFYGSLWPAVPLPNNADGHVQSRTVTHTYYVDVASVPRSKNRGTFDDPWTAPDSVNNHTFHAGDVIKIRRGTTVTRSIKAEKKSQGVVSPQGSGAAGAPIVIDAYGKGPKPVIDAQGVLNTAAIYLYNQEYWTIRNMEVRNNIVPHDSANRGNRWGIRIFVDDFSPKPGIHIVNNIVDSVYGGYFAGGSGGDGCIGISFRSISLETFHNTLIDSNRVFDVWGDGIHFWGAGGAGVAAGRWDSLSNNVVLRGNSVRRTSGNGIVLLGTNDPLIEHNVVDSAAQLGVDNGTGVVGGLWPGRVRNGLVQYNEVGHTKMLYGDGTGFNVDNTVTGSTVFQYNYSHDNEGGFIQESPASDSGYHGTIWRYNISRNDGNNSKYPGKFQTQRGGASMYNNVFYNDTLPFNFPFATTDTFVNNIFWGTGWRNNWRNNMFDHNCYWGGCQDSINKTIDSNAVKKNPLFINAGKSGYGGTPAQFCRLQSGSPCLGAGRSISGIDTGRTGLHGDFRGDPFKGGRPAIGAFQ